MGTKMELDGQLCFDLSTKTDQFVVQANELLEGKQNLKLNSAKIMRSLIMQIKPEDDDLKSYLISVPDLAKLLKISSANIYRDIDEITDDILKNHVAIKDPIKGRFIKIQWVSACAYEKGIGLAIKINPLLKPFLLNLRNHYTQYQLEEVLAMKSVYAIRIYELLQKEKMVRVLPKNGIDLILTIQQIREACDCEDKYERFSQLKSRVIEVAIREIERTTNYEVNYEYIKKGKSIEALKFHINMNYH